MIKKYSLQVGSEWAIVVADTQGFLGIVSTHGNYAYHWSNFGPSFQNFLGELDKSYLVDKITQGRPKHYSPEKTLARVKKHLLDLRMEGDYAISKDDARNEWDFIHKDCNSLTDESDFSNWIDGSRIPDTDLYVSTPDPEAFRFYEVFWEALKSKMREDLLET